MRKVRTPSEKVPGATQEGVSLWTVPQKITAIARLRGVVRVKMCGKSTRTFLAIKMWGKPYLEQDNAAWIFAHSR